MKSRDKRHGKGHEVPDHQSRSNARLGGDHEAMGGEAGVSATAAAARQHWHGSTLLFSPMRVGQAPLRCGAARATSDEQNPAMYHDKKTRTHYRSKARFDHATMMANASLECCQEQRPHSDLASHRNAIVEQAFKAGKIRFAS